LPFKHFDDVGIRFDLPQHAPNLSRRQSGLRHRHVKIFAGVAVIAPLAAVDCKIHSGSREYISGMAGCRMIRSPTANRETVKPLNRARASSRTESDSAI
jgi:hypothetical protein